MYAIRSYYALPAELKKVRYRKTDKGMDVQFANNVVQIFNIGSTVVVDVSYGLKAQEPAENKQEEVTISASNDKTEPPVPASSPAVEVEKAPLSTDEAPKVDEETKVAEVVEPATVVPIRITSYNVCYTKLLRFCCD